MVHTTLTCGDKAQRTTHPSGKDIITMEMQDLQSHWDRLVLSISERKVSLETALLQWADLRSAEARIAQWLQDHQSQLEQVKKIQVTPLAKENITQRRAKLRKANVRNYPYVVVIMDEQGSRNFVFCLLRHVLFTLIILEIE